MSNNLFIYTFTLINLSIVPAFCTIHYGHFEIRRYNGITFGNSEQIKDTIQAANPWNCFPNEFDLIVGDAGSCCLTVNCCCGFRIASPTLMVLSNRPLDSSNILTPLNINDSGLFVKGIPGDSDWATTCYNYVGFLEPSRMGNPDTTRYLNGFLVIKTLRETYVLIDIKKFLHMDMNWPEPFIPNCINGISFDWYEQTDGTTDFSGIRSIGVGSARRAFAPGRIPASPSRAFGIDGRMSRTPRGVVIERGACGTRFSIMMK